MQCNSYDMIVPVVQDISHPFQWETITVPPTSTSALLLTPHVKKEPLLGHLGASGQLRIQRFQLRL